MLLIPIIDKDGVKSSVRLPTGGSVGELKVAILQSIGFRCTAVGPHGFRKDDQKHFLQEMPQDSKRVEDFLLKYDNMMYLYEARHSASPGRSANPQPSVGCQYFDIAEEGTQCDEAGGGEQGEGDDDDEDAST